jgi:predicted Fe-Mo cluster-binding NifX family protein
MKLIFTSTGSTLDAPLDPSFGRARHFLLYDTDSGASQVISNQQNLDAAQGAGIQAAQTIVRAGAEALITGHCGPKAFRVLAAAGVKVYNTDAPTVAAALARFQDRQLTEASSANVESHWA